MGGEPRFFNRRFGQRPFGRPMSRFQQFRLSGNSPGIPQRPTVDPIGPHPGASVDRPVGGFTQLPQRPTVDVLGPHPGNSGAKPMMDSVIAFPIGIPGGSAPFFPQTPTRPTVGPQGAIPGSSPPRPKQNQPSAVQNPQFPFINLRTRSL